MKDVIVEKIDEMRDHAYDALFAEKIELERKKNFWKGLFIVTVCVLGAITIGCVVYAALKKKFSKRLMARFSKEVDDLDFIDLASEDVSVDVVD